MDSIALCDSLGEQEHEQEQERGEPISQQPLASEAAPQTSEI
jgi:hypothetical protein